jgi:hypothetical protein
MELIPVNTGQMQVLVQQPTDIIGNFNFIFCENSGKSSQ